MEPGICNAALAVGLVRRTRLDTAVVVSGTFVARDGRLIDGVFPDQAIRRPPQRATNDVGTAIRGRVWANKGRNRIALLQRLGLTPIGSEGPAQVGLRRPLRFAITYARFAPESRSAADVPAIRQSGSSRHCWGRHTRVETIPEKNCASVPRTVKP